MLAIDHRGPLRRALEKESSAAVPDEALTAFKADVVRALGTVSSAVLLDPEVGAAQCVAGGVLSGQTGLIVALDTGSTGDPGARRTALVDGWSVEKTCRMGASAVKLLIFYHPDAREAAEREELVGTIAEACTRHELPFFLEPLSYSPDNPERPLASRERRAVVIETARRLAPLGVDVLKAEFPVAVAEQPDEAVWRAACEELSAACSVPWVLLSGGVSFDTFLRQTRTACDAGASGVMVGRAVWSEAVTSDTRARRDFLMSVGRKRMDRLRTLCDALGRPFSDVHDAPRPRYGWHATYGEE